MAGRDVGAVVVVGSYAVGMTISVEHAPVAGQTVLGSGYHEGPGGKGSNQAIQIARLGAGATLVGAVGDDRFGADARRLWATHLVNTSLVITTPAATGVGFIVVDADGENRIVLDMGANAHLTPSHVEAAAPSISRGRVVLAQLEIPMETALAAMRVGHRAGALTILNPAPARPLPPEALADIDILTPNESELGILVGRDPGDASDIVADARTLIARGARAVVVTGGSAGATVVTPELALSVPAHAVSVVDTTGAGDAFNGALAVALARGGDLRSAVAGAVVAGSLACRRAGVVPALPTAAELAAEIGPEIGPEIGAVRAARQAAR